MGHQGQGPRLNWLADRRPGCSGVVGGWGGLWSDVEATQTSRGRRSRYTDNGILAKTGPGHSKTEPEDETHWKESSEELLKFGQGERESPGQVQAQNGWTGLSSSRVHPVSSVHLPRGPQCRLSVRTLHTNCYWTKRILSPTRSKASPTRSKASVLTPGSRWRKGQRSLQARTPGSWCLSLNSLKAFRDRFIKTGWRRGHGLCGRLMDLSSDFVDGKVIRVSIINLVSTHMGSVCFWTVCS